MGKNIVNRWHGIPCDRVSKSAPLKHIYFFERIRRLFVSWKTFQEFHLIAIKTYFPIFGGIIISSPDIFVFEFRKNVEGFRE
ncbi:hypothetical protein CJ263_02525 [Maribacter cobaltidurans]|uniref:Uncharacterized protein n=1 Tax=Maribacter cobaltidurans TaxID=1178778 RepID=A0A223V2F8_9FLAO|nr:hypothetical protein CJ263_02525 [Maribacter cobaltidurans]